MIANRPTINTVKVRIAVPPCLGTLTNQIMGLDKSVRMALKLNSKLFNELLGLKLLT